MSGNGRSKSFSHFDRPRRRFVQDGEIPVTVVNPRPRQGIEALGPPRPGVSPHERAEAAEAAMAREAALRDHAERQLHEAQAHLVELQTKNGHAELARAEAEQQMTEARAECARLRTELDTALAALALRAARRAKREEARDPDAPPRRRGRPPKLRLIEDVSVVAVPEAPRRRGRPPKPVSEAPAVPRRRGRPPKNAILAAPEKRKPGRPRKAKLAPLVAVAAKPVKWWLRGTAPTKAKITTARPNGTKSSGAKSSGAKRGRPRKA